MNDPFPDTAPTQSALDHRPGLLGGIPERELAAACSGEEGERVRKGGGEGLAVGGIRNYDHVRLGGAGDNRVLCSWC